jgi:hypothetical protein
MAGLAAKSTSILGIGEISVERFKVDATGNAVADGKNIYYFQTSKVYADTKVQTATGITFIAIEDWKGDEPLIKLEQLILTNKLERYYAQCLATNSKGEEIRKIVQLWCTPDKAATLKGTKGSLKDVELKRTVKGVSVSLGKVFDVRQRAKDSYS